MNNRNRKKTRQAFLPCVDSLEGRLVLSAGVAAHAATAAHPVDQQEQRNLRREQRLERRQQMREQRILRQEQRREHQQLRLARRVRPVGRASAQALRARSVVGAPDPSPTAVPAGPLGVAATGASVRGLVANQLTPLARNSRSLALARPGLTATAVQGASTPVVVGRGGNSTGGTLGTLSTNPLLTSNLTGGSPLLTSNLTGVSSLNTSNLTGGSPFNTFSSMTSPAFNGFSAIPFTNFPAVTNPAADAFGVTPFTSPTSLTNPALTGVGVTPFSNFTTLNNSALNGFQSPFTSSNLFNNVSTTPGMTSIANGIPFNNVGPTGTIVGTAGLNSMGSVTRLNNVTGLNGVTGIVPAVNGFTTTAFNTPLTNVALNAAAPFVSTVGAVMPPPPVGAFSSNTTPMITVI